MRTGEIFGKGAQKNGYIEIAGTDEVVTWLFGHILQQKTPHIETITRIQRADT
ncbi:MAG TPA: hypothetical protein PKA28_04220 [Methylomusa anaerophila]|uniref:hypothetical protein n=1 Tax=Methylomusa anaerophila TaxID=1930071 RepID=UPI0013150C9F|nr:hypothetical protein [Methylomusa anaerophila]HML87633.1 hypothetical protein [Methylomusa anaerophila]